MVAKKTSMYGLIGKMISTEGNRDELIDIILEGSDAMPGCLSYIVAKDAANPDAIWITEVWNSKASHEASLSLPGVQAAIQRAKPLIAEFEESIETEPIGGAGLRGSREREAARRLAKMGGTEPNLKAPPRCRSDP
jgi:quinol monooxygenase YgiN